MYNPNEEMGDPKEDEEDNPYKELKEMWIVAFRDAVEILQKVNLIPDPKVCLEIAKTLVGARLHIKGL